MPLVPDDPFGDIKQIKRPQDAPDPRIVNIIHVRSDLDSSATAQHHTLGIKRDQAAPGGHRHDGRDSKKLMDGITVSGSKGGNVALTDLINKLSDALGFTDATT